MQISIFVSSAILISALHVAGPVAASVESDSEEILASRGETVVTQSEIDAMFSKIPEDNRLAFIRDGAKVDQLIRGVLKRKIVAEDAIAAGYDKDPLIADRMKLSAQKELADAWLEKIVNEAPPVDYEALAHEDYLANPDSYRSEVVLELSHILLGTEERTLEEARIFATHLDRQLQEKPELFDEFVMQYSDDPTKSENGGRYTDMRKGQMARPFEKAAFALENTGDISEPVKTEYGYHIIRLNGRGGSELREFEAVKVAAIARAERKYREEYLARYLRSVLDEPVVLHEGAVEAMARRHFGEDLEKAPVFSE